MREKAFNISTVVTLLVFAYAMAFFILNYGINPEDRAYVFARFAFNPGLYTLSFQESWFSIFTYSFVYYDDFTVFIVNMAWLIVFGSPLANRIGVRSFVFFWIVTSILSALIIYISASQALGFVSGSYSFVSAMIGAGARYNFQRVKLPSEQTEFKGPVLTIRQVMNCPLALALIGGWLTWNLVCMVVFGNVDPLILTEPSNDVEINMTGSPLNWQICMVALLVGFFLIGYFDRRQDRGA